MSIILQRNKVKCGRSSTYRFTPTVLTSLSLGMSSTSAFKVKVLLTRIDNKIAKENGVHVTVAAEDTNRTVKRDLVPAKHDAGIFEFSPTDVPEGHKFTACAKRIDTDDVAT